MRVFFTIMGLAGQKGMMDDAYLMIIFSDERVPLVSF